MSRTTVQGILKVNEDTAAGVQVLDSQTGQDLLHLIPVESVRLDVSITDRRLSLELSPWAFDYKVAPADLCLTYRGERIKAVVVGDDVCARTVPVEELLKEKLTNGKQTG
jgi:hypothetical protein